MRAPQFRRAHVRVGLDAAQGDPLPKKSGRTFSRSLKQQFSLADVSSCSVRATQQKEGCHPMSSSSDKNRSSNIAARGTASSRQARSVGNPPALAHAPGLEIPRGSARLPLPRVGLPHVRIADRVSSSLGLASAGPLRELVRRLQPDAVRSRGPYGRGRFAYRGRPCPAPVYAGLGCRPRVAASGCARLPRPARIAGSARLPGGAS
jgi:hypothetical protein